MVCHNHHAGPHLVSSTLKAERSPWTIPALCSPRMPDATSVAVAITFTRLAGPAGVSRSQPQSTASYRYSRATPHNITCLSATLYILYPTQCQQAAQQLISLATKATKPHPGFHRHMSACYKEATWQSSPCGQDEPSSTARTST